MGRFYLTIIVMLLLFQTSLFSQQEVKIPDKQLPVTEENIAKGKEIYTKWCSFCHSTEGKGDGPVADYLYPRLVYFSVSNLPRFSPPSGDEVLAISVLPL